MVTVLGIVAYRAELKTRTAEQLAELRTRTAEQLAEQAEVEQGRQALLNNDYVEALLHLSEAYRHGDHSPGVLFMLARALQPRMAEQAHFADVKGLHRRHGATGAVGS